MRRPFATSLLYDISRPLLPPQAFWPGDPGVQAAWTHHHDTGDRHCVTHLSLSTHSGTHVDAPLHFLPDADPIDAVPLERFWGPALVLQTALPDGPRALSLDDLALACRKAHLADDAWSLAERLLLRTDTHRADTYTPPYATLSPDLAERLADAGVRLVGIDTPSVDAEDSDFEAHKTLLRSGATILEWLDLSAVRPGAYTLSAFPLHLAGRDGSPVRAVLRDD